MGRILIILVALIAMGTAAHAQTTLAAGGLFGGPTQNVALCYFYNAGTSPVTVTGGEIVQETSTVLPLAGNNCVAPLTPGKICRFFATPISTVFTHACKATITPDATDVRGTLEIRAANSGGAPGATLQTEQLR
jgi:hypothetical protein